MTASPSRIERMRDARAMLRTQNRTPEIGIQNLRIEPERSGHSEATSDLRFPASRYCEAQTMRAIQSIRSIGKVKFGWVGLKEASSIVFAVRRTRILAMTSPSVVRSTTRSPLRAAELGETIKISPSR